MSNWVDIPSTYNKNTSIYSNIKSHEEKSKLGKDEFLRILITQLSNQDPSNPLQDKDFIAQMATFSSLEQMTNLNSAFGKFANQQMSQYAVSIGKEITWTPGGQTSPLTGVVTGVSTENGNYYYLAGDTKVPVDAVTKIMQNQTESK